MSSVCIYSAGKIKKQTNINVCILFIHIVFLIIDITALYQKTHTQYIILASTGLKTLTSLY